MVKKQEVTEFDLRRPEFQDPKLTPDMFEFDADGEVVRKDRFERGIQRVLGALIENNFHSSREKWTVDIVISKVKSTFSEFQRLKELSKIINLAPPDAEFYHFENEQYIRNIDQEELEIAKNEQDASHTVSFEYYSKDAWEEYYSKDAWEMNSGWIDLINVLVSMDDIKKEIQTIAGYKND